MEQYKNDLNRLTELLTAGVSPLHTIRHSMNLLESRGFTELSLDKAWALEPGKGYFVNAFDTTLIGFTVGEDAAEHPSFRIASSHTDWPCLMVKPSPEISAEGYAKLNVAVYGGPILSTWLDRPLSLAGKVCTVSEDPFHPQVHLVDFKRPILTVPNLAIHFNREVNNGVALNPQIDMQPILAMLDETLNKDSFFLDLVAEELHVNKEDILDYQFYIYNCDMPQTLGIHNEFLSAPRLLKRPDGKQQKARYLRSCSLRQRGNRKQHQAGRGLSSDRQNSGENLFKPWIQQKRFPGRSVRRLPPLSGCGPRLPSKQG